MAPDPVLHERIYAGFKDDLREGRLPPGHHIDLQAISERYRASVTPVREVVCRLMGEGLAEFQRHGGFHVATLSANEIRDLYVLNSTIVLRAIQTCTDADLDEAMGAICYPRPGATPLEVASCSASIFSTLVGSANNSAFLKLVENINDRLGFVRIAECHLLRDVHRELLMLNHGPNGQLRRTLNRRITNYHRRRIHIVERIADERIM
ncbi:GntR family transcriptional regulator [Sphingomonas sp. CGMCC 1.13654]|uniref:GntR family transcriptional regulator n=1 Tax=Sphingomonas chungangi TaxID=2683589 RepID=A0A838L6Q7_9SPHN|nr:GntR family transcriptional regulator [Sphingomonas chungangi]